MRVDYSEWYVDQPGLCARRYTYSQLGEGYNDFNLEVHFDIQAGMSIFTFLTIIIENIDLTKECGAFIEVEPMDHSRPRIRIKMQATPNNYRVVLGMANPNDVRSFLSMFMLGKEMHFRFETEFGEVLSILPLPNDPTFQVAYNSAYERVVRADREEIGDQGIMGRVNRFLQS